MSYLLALIIPPVAIFIAGKPIQGIINAIIFVISILVFIGTLGFGSFLSFPLWVVAVIHALFVVHGNRNDQRTRDLISAASNRLDEE